MAYAVVIRFSVYIIIISYTLSHLSRQIPQGIIMADGWDYIRTNSTERSVYTDRAALLRLYMSS